MQRNIITRSVYTPENQTEKETKKTPSDDDDDDEMEGSHLQCLYTAKKERDKKERDKKEIRKKERGKKKGIGKKERKR